MHNEHFDDLIVPHLDAAHNLARWLVRGEEADDVAQESFLRAFRYFGTFRGGMPAPGCSPSSATRHSGGWRGTAPTARRSSSARNNMVRRVDRGTPKHSYSKALTRAARSGHEPAARTHAGSAGAARAGRPVVQGDRRSCRHPHGTVMSTLYRARERFRQAVTDLIATGSNRTWRIPREIEIQHEPDSGTKGRSGRLLPCSVDWRAPPFARGFHAGAGGRRGRSR